MKNTEKFDVLIVYSDGIARSASSLHPTPFSSKSKHSIYNETYAYFLEQCKKNNLKAAFTTSKNITKDGCLDSYWLFENKKWIKVRERCIAPLIFDKFFPRNKIQKDRRRLLFSNIGVEPYTNNNFLNLFYDKQETYNKLEKFSLPTVILENARQDSIDKAISELQELIDNHPNKADFAKKIIIKDRFGAGGNNIFCTKSFNRRKYIKDIINKNKNISFVLQPFTDFQNRQLPLNRKTFNDIRLIFLNNKLIQSYVRTAAINNFLCNEHKGGVLTYISKKNIPNMIINKANEILLTLGNQKSIFALDFIISKNGNTYLMEGNTSPGLDWDSLKVENELNAKKLIREIVRDISIKIDNSNKVIERNAYLAEDTNFIYS